MSVTGWLCGVPVVGVVGFLLIRSLRNRGRRVLFSCTQCGAQESLYERGLDIRAALSPVCGRCQGPQTISVEGADSTGDVETFGRSPGEGGSLVTCTCGDRHIVPGACDVIIHRPQEQVTCHVRPVACPRCGTQFVLLRPQGAPAEHAQADGACSCGVAPVPLRRGLVLRCKSCSKRNARVLLMS